MRVIICAAVLSALAAGPALSKEAPNAGSQGVEAVAKAPRTVYICDNSTMTRRAFAREFGAVEFVKADAAANKGAAWATPKCITASEARRLKQLASAR